MFKYRKDKNMKNRLYKFKQDSGSITLFVLIAVIFFAVILSSVYISNMNALDNQNSALEQIRSNYSKVLSNMNDKYNEILRILNV